MIHDKGLKNRQHWNKLYKIIKCECVCVCVCTMSVCEQESRKRKFELATKGSKFHYSMCTMTSFGTKYLTFYHCENRLIIICYTNLIWGVTTSFLKHDRSMSLIKVYSHWKNGICFKWNANLKMQLSSKNIHNNSLSLSLLIKGNKNMPAIKTWKWG